MDIDKLQAGSELDKLVAENALGWTELTYMPGTSRLYGIPPDNRMRESIDSAGIIKACLPAYSTDIVAAWEIVNKIGKVSVGVWHNKQRCAARIITRYGFPDSDDCYTIAETEPLALCRMALKWATFQ